MQVDQPGHDDLVRRVDDRVTGAAFDRRASGDNLGDAVVLDDDAAHLVVGVGIVQREDHPVLQDQARHLASSHCGPRPCSNFEKA